MFKLLRQLKPYLPNVLLVLVMLFSSAMADLYLPTLMANIVNIGIVHADMAYILRTGTLMLAVALGGVTCALVGSFNSSRVALGFSRHLRQKLFSRVESYSFKEFDRIGTASLITRTTNDVNQLQRTLTMMLGMFVRAPIMGIGGIVMAFLHDRTLALIFFVAIPVLAGILFFIAGRGVPLFRIMQKKLDRLNLVIREKLSGVRVVRAFDRVTYEQERFDQANADLTSTGISLVRLMTTLMPLMMIIMNFTVIAIVWFGSLRAEAGQMHVGDIMAFIQYALQILFALMMVSMLFIMIPRAQVSAGRINEVLDLQPEIKNPPFPKAHAAERGTVAFNKVFFSYHGAEEPALEDISFCAQAGQVTAIIGSTGSGKTTLVSLLPRFYDVTGGSVCLSGVDLRDLDLEQLRRRIGYVPQKATLFTGTIRDNLRFGREDAGDDELIAAAQTAQAWPFIQAMEGGLDAMLVRGGANLSGGQKQRLAIARALVRKPEIYIFDDCFSALDFKTDAALRQALRQELTGVAILMVAQRVTTVMNAERILVLDEGRLVGQGRHQDLLTACPVYKEIVYSQLSQEELA